MAGFQVSIEFDPRGSKLRSVLPPNLQALQLYSSQKDGLLKLGALDIHGDGYIPAGNAVDLLILETDGPVVSSLRIKEAILADRNGRVVPVKIVAEEEKRDSRPEEFALLHNYPNPFNPQNQISYALPQDCDVKLTIYNLLGQSVRILVDEHQMAGYKKIFWDGKDEQGRDVASGVYFYKIHAGDFVQTKKMLLLK